MIRSLCGGVELKFESTFFFGESKSTFEAWHKFKKHHKSEKKWLMTFETRGKCFLMKENWNFSHFFPFSFFFCSILVLTFVWTSPKRKSTKFEFSTHSRHFLLSNTQNSHLVIEIESFLFLYWRLTVECTRTTNEWMNEWLMKFSIIEINFWK